VGGRRRGATLAGRVVRERPLALHRPARPPHRARTKSSTICKEWKVPVFCLFFFKCLQEVCTQFGQMLSEKRFKTVCKITAVKISEIVRNYEKSNHNLANVG